MSDQRAIVICKSCGARKDVSIGKCLSKGWPKCCKATMGLAPDTPADKFNVAMDDLLRPITERLINRIRRS